MIALALGATLRIDFGFVSTGKRQMLAMQILERNELLSTLGDRFREGFVFAEAV